MSALFKKDAASAYANAEEFTVADLFPTSRCIFIKYTMQI